MFGFFRKRPTAPPLCPGNPGVGTEARIAFTRDGRSCSETVDVVRLAAEVLQTHGHAITAERTWLRDRESGLVLQPQFVQLRPLDQGGVGTVTTIQVNHPTFLPGGLFEYQHATGDSAAASLARGFDQWAQTDLVTLADALRATPEQCTAMVLELPPRVGRPARARRAVLGPIAHLQAEPPPTAPDADPDEHPFCPCCLLTRSFEAFKDLLEGEGVYGLRLFAARDAEDQPQADCRINGEDYEPGAAALRAYAATWPPAGFEFRKQYVVLHTLDRPGP